MVGILVLAATLLSVQKNGVDLTVEAGSRTVDPARTVAVSLTLKSGPGIQAGKPVLKAKGFSVEPGVDDDPATAEDGSCTAVYSWRLVPEPCAESYKIMPFAVVATSAGSDVSFWTEPIYFEAPPARAPAEGGMEVAAPREVAAGIPWKIVGWCMLASLGILLLVVGVGLAGRTLLRMLREHRMSPIERAWVELDRLLKKGLPGRGRYKDFYVELTMVVRRYVQRKYGIRAPHLTTEEFLREARPSDALRRFLESADMVKFAGVEATPEMADEATQSARTYLRSDDATPRTKEGRRA